VLTICAPIVQEYGIKNGIEITVAIMNWISVSSQHCGYFLNLKHPITTVIKIIITSCTGRQV